MINLLSSVFLEIIITIIIIISFFLNRVPLMTDQEPSVCL